MDIKEEKKGFWREVIKRLNKLHEKKEISEYYWYHFRKECVEYLEAASE